MATLTCSPGMKFIILDLGATAHIELREKNGNFVRSICCERCLPDLKRAIADYEKVLEAKRLKR